MIPPPAPVPPLSGRDSKATMINDSLLQVRVTTEAFITAAPEAHETSRREAQGVG